MREAGGAAAGISIHALHEESDAAIFHLPSSVGYFNPRSP